MSSYSNVNDFIVILADDRDPDVSWQHHLDRGSAGGVDCVARQDTRLYAPMDCIVSSYWGGTGGLTIRMAAVDGSGWVDEFMHASAAPVTGRVRQGGYVGDSGSSGGNYAPHVHWHRYDADGNRRNPWHYFDASAPAGGDEEPIPDESEEDTMALRQMHYYTGETAIRGLFSEESGYFSRWQTGKESGTIANSMASNWDTGGSVEVTKSLFDRIEADMGKARAGTA